MKSKLAGFAILTSIAAFCFLMNGKIAQAEIVSGKTERAVVAGSGATQAIQSKFVAKGVSSTEASNLVNQMSSEEISYYDSNMDRTQVAGDSVAGAIIFILVVVALVYLIIYLAQRT